MNKSYSHLLLGLAAGALFFSGCGKSADEASAKAAIPEAPDEAMKVIFTEIADGNGGIIWEAMPATYQGDVNKVVRLAGTKIDAELYDKTMALMGRIGSVANKQKGFILNNSFLAEADQTQKDQMEQVIPALAQLLDLIAKSDIGTSAGLQAFDGQKFFDTTVTSLTKLSLELASLDDGDQISIADLRDATFSIAEQTETTATIHITAAGEADTSDFVKVEDRWVPVEMADDWTSSIAQAISELEAIDPEEMAAQNTQIMTVITMLDGVLNQLDNAETQEQFDQALQGAMMPMMGMMMMFQGMGGEGSMPSGF